ncbi:MAG: hypothetical protein ABEI99_02255, partial [Halobaculum sp.]
MKLLTSEAREQLGVVASEVWRGTSSIIGVLTAAILLYVPILGNFEVLSTIESVVALDHLLWYTACSFAGATLFLSANLIGHDDTETSAASGDDIEDTNLRESLWVLFVQVAKINAITVLLFSGAVAGVLVGHQFGTGVAVFVSALYPAADMGIYRRLGHPVTPVTMLMVLSYIPAVVATVGLVITLIAVGLVLGPPFVVVKSVGRLG